MNEFEKIENKLDIIKETEKAIAVETEQYYGASSCGYEYKRLKWIPKSVAQIIDNKLVALKGWFIDKNCGDCLELVSKEAIDRFEARYCK